MKGSTGITDNNWFAFLSQRPGIDEEKGAGFDFSQSRLFWNATMPYQRRWKPVGHTERSLIHPQPIPASPILIAKCPVEFRSSSPKELPLQALTEPDVNLSVHPALIIQPMTVNRTSVQITAFDSF